MRAVSWKKLMIAAFLTNFGIALIMWSYLDSRCECLDTQHKYSSYVRLINEKHGKECMTNFSATELANKIIIIIREFEFFENDITDTVKSITEVLPTVKILIIVDKSPYPPLRIESTAKENVQIISLKHSLLKSLETQWPFYFIDKEHILLIPDSVRIRTISQILDMLEFHQLKPKNIVAVKVSGQKTQCLSLNVNLRYWTLKYGKNLDDSQCNALEGDHVLLVTKTLLMQLSHPFARPFPHSLFIQTSLHKLKIEMMKDKIFEKGKNLFNDPHSKWKHESLEQDRKRLLYEDFGIKKVLLPASRVEWYGCNKNTARCFGTVIDNMPEYLFEGKWTPPCCMENLRQTARYVFGILEKCGVRYWLEGGSLLGAARNNDLIPWDYDIDIGIYKEDITKCEWLKNSLKQSIIDTQGFVWEKANEGDFIRVQFSQSNHLHVDIFPFYSRNGTMTKDTWFVTHKQDMEFPEHYLKPLERINFVGVSASIPNNYVKFLELKFGKDAISKPEYPDPNILQFSKRNY